MKLWGMFELELEGPREGNPFVDVTVSATFAHGGRHVTVEGFYDGNGTYRVRFMPDEIGEWRYETASPVSAPFRRGRSVRLHRGDRPPRASARGGCHPVCSR